MIGIDILKEDSITYPFPIEAGLVVSGTISQDHHPLQEASVQIYNTANQDATITKTDANGHFDAQLKDYADGTKLYMQAYSKKGETGNYLYKLDEYAFHPSNNLKPTHRMLRRQAIPILWLPTIPD